MSNEYAYATSNDPVAIMQSYIHATWYGIPVDKDMPPAVGVTMEMIDGQAVITSAVLKGDKGDPGDNAPLLNMQWPPKATAAELPDDLTEADALTSFWVGSPTPSLIYCWTGTYWQPLQAGPPGPPGPRPVITPKVEVIPMSERTPGMTSEVIVTGSEAFPQYLFRLLAPQGPVGPTATISTAADYNAGKAKQPGQVLTVNSDGTKWEPSDFAAKHPRLYSIPEQAFTPFSGLAQRKTILSYTIPAQDYDWTPYVTGHFRAYGIEIDSDPLTIGSEVRLGDATSGTLIARGFGNNSTWTTVVPHWSTPSSPTAAVAPDNGVALVPAGQTAQINVNLYNDGLIGAYIFGRDGAQLAVLTIPQG
ncbi:phage tail protein [Mycobacteroides abscessus]|uniref:phage tail protein n=1 Tax=Mycobacteroides abscessus TaxID=36809 RepID=UPI0009C89AC8|nr:phage tail protein [Mycobacteroides abscessus]QSM04176.1 minor tail protein [Mycobacterium phage prophiGD51-2]MBE5436479.1 hypothetical protein [Mycobacteroides abscessus]MDM1901637.1 phage tail protein [Mycobacteroides abscessus]MDM1962712.1 phage tail protein [Mycobacteroides abscessus]MDM1967192.1 phage tail protein [Mycobacteroides abscessus]